MGRKDPRTYSSGSHDAQSKGPITQRSHTAAFWHTNRCGEEGAPGELETSAQGPCTAVQKKRLRKLDGDTFSKPDSDGKALTIQQIIFSTSRAKVTPRGHHLGSAYLGLGLRVRVRVRVRVGT